MRHPYDRGRPRHPDILTPAEWRVADSVRHGLTNPQIARRMGVSLDAVKFHVSNILTKLGLPSRRELRLWRGVAADSKLDEETKMPDQPSIGSIGQIARTVSDIALSRAWYRDVLHLQPLFDAGNMAFFDCDGVRLMLREGEAGPESILYFRTDNLHGEIQRLETAGVKVVSAPHRIHTHEDGSEEWMAFIEDNDGRPLGLMSVVQNS